MLEWSFHGGPPSVFQTLKFGHWRRHFYRVPCFEDSGFLGWYENWESWTYCHLFQCSCAFPSRYLNVCDAHIFMMHINTLSLREACIAPAVLCANLTHQLLHRKASSAILNKLPLNNPFESNAISSLGLKKHHPTRNMDSRPGHIKQILEP